MTPSIHYCNQCGDNVVQEIPPGETLVRAVCVSCRTVHYQNPKIVAGCIPEWKEQILLCQRAIEPRKGFWTFPAGFMEMGESVEEAAARETLEEAQANVNIHSLYGLYSLRHVGQVHVVFRGILQQPTFSPGEESLDVQLITIQHIPWEALAFPIIRAALTHYVEDRQHGTFGMHVETVSPIKNVL